MGLAKITLGTVHTKKKIPNLDSRMGKSTGWGQRKWIMKITEGQLQEEGSSQHGTKLSNPRTGGQAGAGQQEAN